MFLTITFVVGILGHLSSGVPLESPSSDFSQFFDQRIVGGSEAAKDASPSMVALVIGYIWQSFVCGGSIITKNHVLTAAHCITENWDGGLLDTFHAMIGTNTWHKGTLIEFKCHKLHPHYDYWTIKNDVGILTTKYKIQLNERVAIIALNYDFVGGGEKSYVTGWGTEWLWGNLPDYLQILHVTTISPQECIDGVKEATALPDVWWAPHVDPELEVCTLHSPGHGMCHGDSGSALVSLANKKQFGIVSWSSAPCARGAPDVYVRLRGVKDFIQAAIRFNCTIGAVDLTEGAAIEFSDEN